MQVRPKELLERNAEWAAERIGVDPEYFRRLSALQTPEFLWIGCSDSRVPANVITGLEPGEVFVHRNVANIVHAGDMNALSVLHYAIDVLKVSHVIVCGHYGCGGVRAAMERNTSGLIDHWLEPIRDVAAAHEAELEAIADIEARLERLCELNVRAQVQRLRATPVLRSAWRRRQPVSIHGWVYGLADGRIRDLGCTCSGPERRTGAAKR